MDKEKLGTIGNSQSPNQIFNEIIEFLQDKYSTPDKVPSSSLFNALCGAIASIIHLVSKDKKTAMKNARTSFEAIKMFVTHYYKAEK